MYYQGVSVPFYIKGNGGGRLFPLSTPHPLKNLLYLPKKEILSQTCKLSKSP